MRRWTVQLVALLVACRAPGAARSESPAFHFADGAYAGSPLGGAGVGGEPRVTDGQHEAFRVRWEAWAVGELAARGLLPLAAHASLLTEPHDDAPLRPTSGLIAAGHVGREVAPWTAAWQDLLWADESALEPGHSAFLVIRDAAGSGLQLELHLHRSAAGDGTSVHLLRRAAGGGPASMEQALLDLAPEADGVALLLALPLSDGRGELLCRVALDRPAADDDTWAATLARSRTLTTAVERRAAGVRATAQALAAADGALEAALAVLDRPGERRAGLLHLATQCGAGIAADLCLVASAALLDDLAAGTRARLSVAAGPRSAVGDAPDAQAAGRARVGWAMERAALGLLVESAERRADAEREPGLLGLLLRGTGEVGRNPTLLLGLLDETADVADLSRRLLAENLLFLDDPAPAARVRAFDWLDRRGAAPAGFDPLAERGARRAALARHRAAAAGAP